MLIFYLSCKSWSQHLYTSTVVRWLCDLVRCRKTSHDHSTTSWEGRTHDNMWIYGTNIRDVACRQERLHDVARWLYCTLQSRASRPGFWTWPKTAKTLYHIARLRTNHPRWYTITQTAPIAGVRLKARCDHSLRYLKLNALPWHNVVRGRSTIAQDIYEKAVRCISLIYVYHINIFW